MARTTGIQDRAEAYSGLLKVALALAIIGALNWGLIGFFNWNLVDAIFGGGSREVTSTFSRVIYAIVGLAGLGALAMFPWGRTHRPPDVTHTDVTGRREARV